MKNNPSLEELILGMREKEFQVKITKKEFTPLITIKIDGKMYKYKVINNELVPSNTQVVIL